MHRTSAGWRVGGTELGDLTSAMVLADLIAAEEQASEHPGGRPPGRPPRAPDGAGEAERLRVTVAQLEHALNTRVVVEQAIGVVTERHRVSPRDAFERLRQVARSGGRRVAEVAGDVVTSATNPLVPLPAELARPQPGGGGAARRRR
ncbi:ANTAR domain-containing protein [Allonocardiopsis opalescens]|uniref:ANTAR domain-containing protein n=1 Tax=Allonocardiopsis opalescens TaxID=1144618 RepID=UPI001FE5BF75|nr:ANTAR domain-containing protein [Allonocardiopsis opalescens]